MVLPNLAVLQETWLHSSLLSLCKIFCCAVGIVLYSACFFLFSCLPILPKWQILLFSKLTSLWGLPSKYLNLPLSGISTDCLYLCFFCFQLLQINFHFLYNVLQMWFLFTCNIFYNSFMISNLHIYNSLI